MASVYHHAAGCKAPFTSSRCLLLSRRSSCEILSPEAPKTAQKMILLRGCSFFQL